MDARVLCNSLYFLTRLLYFNHWYWKKRKKMNEERKRATSRLTCTIFTDATPTRFSVTRGNGTHYQIQRREGKNYFASSSTCKIENVLFMNAVIWKVTLKWLVDNLTILINKYEPVNIAINMYVSVSCENGNCMILRFFSFSSFYDFHFNRVCNRSSCCN